MTSVGESNRGRSRTASYQSVSDLDLPFLPHSVIEHWLLATDSEEISLIFEEIGDLYKLYPADERKQIESDGLINTVKKVLDNLTINDAAVRLNGVKLLDLIAEDQTKPFQSVLFVLFSMIQDFFQDSSRVLRNATLKLAVNIASHIPFPAIAKNLNLLLENNVASGDAIASSEYSIKVVSIALLNANVRAYDDDNSDKVDFGLSTGGSTRISFSGASFQLGITQLIKQGLKGLCNSNMQSRSFDSCVTAFGPSSQDSTAGFNDTADSSSKRYAPKSPKHAAVEVKMSPTYVDAMSDLVALGLLALKDSTVDCSVFENHLDEERPVTSRDYEQMLYDSPAGIHCEVFYKNVLLQLKNENNAYTVSMHIQKDLLKRIKTLTFPSLVGDITLATKTNAMVETLKQYYATRLLKVKELKSPSRRSDQGITGEQASSKSLPIASSVPLVEKVPLRRCLSDSLGEDGAFSQSLATTLESNTSQAQVPSSLGPKYSPSWSAGTASLDEFSNYNTNHDSLPGSLVNSLNPNELAPSLGSGAAEFSRSRHPGTTADQESDDLFASGGLDRSKLTGIKKSSHSQQRRTHSANPSSGQSSRRSSAASASEEVLSLDVSAMRTGMTLCRTPPRSGSGRESYGDLSTPLRLQSTDTMHINDLGTFSDDEGAMGRGADPEMRRVSSRHTFNTPHPVGKYTENGERVNELQINYNNSMAAELINSGPDSASTYHRAASSRLKRSRLKSANNSAGSVHDITNSNGQSLSTYLPSSAVGSAYDLSSMTKSIDSSCGSQGYGFSIAEGGAHRANSFDDGGDEAVVAYEYDFSDKRNDLSNRFEDTAAVTVASPVKVKRSQVNQAKANASQPAMWATNEAAVQNSSISKATSFTLDRLAPEKLVPMPSLKSPRAKSPRPFPIKSVSDGSGSINFDNVESSGLTTKSENFEYTASEDILPSTNPTGEYTKALRLLETQEWPDIFHTLNNLRKVALHHPTVIIQSASLHSLVQLLMKQVDNLRSSLAKNAIITLGDLLTGLGSKMDGELSTLIGILLKRSSDSSNFISESADATLVIMVSSSSALRALQTLVSQADHKNAVVRAKVAQFIHLLVSTRHEELRGATREVDGLKQKLGKLLRDQTPDARLYGRHIVKVLLSTRLVQRDELEQTVPADLVEKSLKDNTPIPTGVGSVNNGQESSSTNSKRPSRSSSPYRNISNGPNSNNSSNAPTPKSNISRHPVNKGLELNLGTQLDDNYITTDNSVLSPNDSIAQDRQWYQDDASGAVSKFGKRSRNVSATGNPDDRKLPSKPPRSAVRSEQHSANGSQMTAGAAKRIMESDPDLIALQDVLAGTATNSWTDRRDALSRLTELVVKHAAVLRQAAKLGACVDAILVRLEDGSVKVVAHALQCLERIFAEEPSVLQASFLQVVAPALLSSAASATKTISQSSFLLLQELFAQLPVLQTAQYLSKVAQHEREKLRLTALKYLSEHMGQFCCDPDSIALVVKKILFPTLTKVMFSAATKADVRMATIDAVKALQTQLGGSERVWLWVEESSQQEELRRITC